MLFISLRFLIYLTNNLVQINSYFDIKKSYSVRGILHKS